MALLVRKCIRCERIFEILTTVKHSMECPYCGGEGYNIPQKTADCVYTKIYFGKDANLVHQSHMRQKKMLDARADEIKSGELDLKLQGDKEYWPDVVKEKRLH